ncbi:hypothetical protein C0995_015117 [Termitomyces sp. Mi166|nr:hypothetical protein C0995_015117 [Termitomyces sp. Mi166\
MLPDYENQQIGTVTIASLSSNFSSEPNAIRFDTQPRPGATVASLVNLWMNKGRDQYRALLSDAEESELVISGSMDAFRNFEQEMRALKGPYRIPIPCAVGTFY